MKRSLLAILVLLSTTAAFADSAPAPDFSRDTILKILHDKDVDDAPFKIDIGMAQLRTKNFNYRFAYLPLLAPIQYSGPHGASQLPNPFVLTNTELAWRPHQYVAEPDDYTSSGEYRREYRRVAKMLKRQHIVVNP
jgi:hypothetical protein